MVNEEQYKLGGVKTFSLHIRLEQLNSEVFIVSEIITVIINGKHTGILLAEISHCRTCVRTLHRLPY